jgi:hypothetical protein
MKIIFPWLRYPLSRERERIQRIFTPKNSFFGYSHIEAFTQKSQKFFFSFCIQHLVLVKILSPSPSLAFSLTRKRKIYFYFLQKGKSLLFIWWCSSSNISTMVTNNDDTKEREKERIDAGSSLALSLSLQNWNNEKKYFLGYENCFMLLHPTREKSMICLFFEIKTYTMMGKCEKGDGVGEI